MSTPKLPKDIWAHIRSFSGPNESTPTAELIHRDIAVRDDSTGTWPFPFGRDGYASTVYLALSPAYFANKRDWLWSYPNKTFIRVLHLNYDGRGGYPINAITS